jgi:molecular chaperone DnaJ
MNDAYSLLGLSPGVAQHDIKRAFRKLAMRWHPDRNPDPAAQEHFRALRAAYEYLLADADTQEDVAAPESKASRGPDRRQELTLGLEEAFGGCEKPVRLVQEATCADCAGRGEEVLAHSRLCEHCLGSGRVRVGGGGLERCDACEGRGYSTRRTCTTCKGSGRQQSWRTLSVKIPPGLLAGDELRIAGEGEPSLDADGQPGDLRLRIVLSPHALYQLEGRNLRLSRPMSALRMLAGGEIDVPVPGRIIKVQVAAGSAMPREVRVEGAGFPAGRGQPAGALIVELEPVLPEGCDAHARRLIEELDTELSRKTKRHFPHVADWEADWLHGRRS